MKILLHCIMSVLCFLPLQAMEKDSKKRKAEDKASHVDLKRSKAVVSQGTPLPDDCWHNVLSFLSHGMEQQGAQDWAHFGRVSKGFQVISQDWLQEYLKTSREYKLFKQVMKIQQIAKDASEKSIAAGEVSLVSLGEQYKGDYDPEMSQAKRGLFLKIGSHPSSLATPWGRVMLYWSVEGEKVEAFNARFFRRVATAFYDVPVARVPNVHYYQVAMTRYLEPEYRAYQPEDVFVEPAREQMASLRDQPILVYTSMCHWVEVGACGPIRDIRAVDGEAVEASLGYSGSYLDGSANRRSSGYAKKQWSILKKMYEKEMLQTSGSKAK